MAAQSMVMGDAFGRAFQYGKRKISAMTNEEFNEYTRLDMAEEIFTDYEKIIPSLENSIRASTNLQKMIVNELLKLPANLASGVIEEIDENINKAVEPETAVSQPEIIAHTVSQTKPSIDVGITKEQSKEPATIPRYQISYVNAVLTHTAKKIINISANLTSREWLATYTQIVQAGNAAGQPMRARWYSTASSIKANYYNKTKKNLEYYRINPRILIPA